MLLRWKHEQPVSGSSPASVSSAPSAWGMQYMRQSPGMHAILLRVTLFFLQSMGLLALLPLVARNLKGGRCGYLYLLLAAIGTGAIITALFLHRLRQFMTPRRAGPKRHPALRGRNPRGRLAPNLYVSIPAMLAAGAAWISVANSLRSRPRWRCRTGSARAACRSTRWR